MLVAEVIHGLRSRSFVPKFSCMHATNGCRSFTLHTYRPIRALLRTKSLLQGTSYPK